jgi:quinol monooxygenase YgiN
MNLEERQPQLDRLFTEYRDACGSPDASANFMPTLWTKIEAKQSKGLFFERIARTFVATTMAACGMLGFLMLMPNQQPSSAFLNSSYVEAVATANAHETAPYVSPVRFDFGQDDSVNTDPEYR